MDVTLGDGRTLEVAGQGTLLMYVNLPDRSTRKCRLLDVLYVAYNLLSVSKAAENGKVTKFDEAGCRILDRSGRLVAQAWKSGSLYYLDCRVGEQVSMAQEESKQTSLWHRRFGHLAVRGLQMLARDGLVRGLNCSFSGDVEFCEACVSTRGHLLKQGTAVQPNH